MEPKPRGAASDYKCGGTGPPPVTEGNPAGEAGVTLLAADEAHRVDGATLLQHFEVQVRAGGAARGADQGDRLTLLNRVADGDQHALIVRIARHVPVAVIDLDALAVAEALLRIRHDARGHGDDLRPRGTREIQTAMERAATGERVGAMPEVRGDPALLHRPAVRHDLAAEVASGDQALEHAELALAVFDLAGEVVEHVGQLGRGHHRALHQAFRTADRGLAVEVELALV